MATVARRAPRPLNEALRHDFASFDFYQLVRLLDAQLRGSGGEGTGGWSATSSAAPAALRVTNRLRFSADLSLGFPASEVSGVTEMPARQGSRSGRAATDNMVLVSTPNYCISSYLGPLPEPFHEWMQQRSANGDRAMADFLDLFNHRLNVLRFSLKSGARLSLNNLPPAQSPLGRPLASIMGLGTPGLIEQLPLPPRAALGFAGLLSNGRRSDATIRQVLHALLGVEVAVRQFQGAWSTIDEGAQIRLGEANSTLGRTASLGHRVWLQDARIELMIGPLSYRQYCDLLPEDDDDGPPSPGDGGPRPTPHRRLVELARYLTGAEVDIAVRLQAGSDAPPRSFIASRPVLRRLREADPPEAGAGSAQPESGTGNSASVVPPEPEDTGNSLYPHLPPHFQGMRLGYTSWLNSVARDGASGGAAEPGPGAENAPGEESGPTAGDPGSTRPPELGPLPTLPAFGPGRFLIPRLASGS